MNDHLSLFISDEFSHFPNGIAIKKRPMNWITPIFVTPRHTKKPIMMITASSGGDANIQTIVKIISSYFLKKDFRYHPTIAHFINRIRTIFRFYQISKFTTESDENFTVPTIIFEKKFNHARLLSSMNETEMRYIPEFRIELNNTEHFSFVSAAVFGKHPSPRIYRDARGTGSAKWYL